MARDQQQAATAARNLGPEIELLRSFEVPASRIATILKETAANVRKISERAQFPNRIQIEVPAPPVRKAQIEEFLLYGKKHKAVEQLEWEVEELFSRYVATYQFSEGARVLENLLQQVSAPTNPLRIRLRARIHHHIAWLAIQQGKAKSALAHGQFAMELSRGAYQISWDRVDLNRYVETALIVSMAAHLSAEGQNRSEMHSLAILGLAKEAARAAGNPRGSEHLRQRGSALFYLGYDDQARRCFLKAMQRAQDKNEARDETHVQMIGKRFLNLLGKTPDWDGAQELLSKIEQTFGKNSLEYAINVNYTAAAGLLAQDSTIEQNALTLLSANATLIDPFGRQATVAKLLSITPEFGLSPAHKSRWIKQALRANGLRKL
jgi:tetratricopeptide (TPR) repeat protein